jgi:hypothetical protein
VGFVILFRYLFGMKGLVKQLLREGLNTLNHKEIVEEFVQFACEILSIPHDNIPDISLQANRDGLTTTASYASGLIRVYVKERALADVLRSLAHELTHCKQDIESRLNNPDLDGKTGSPIENEANTMAGIIIRQFGEKHSEIYD